MVTRSSDDAGKQSGDGSNLTADRLVESAAHLFRRHGFAATSTRELSDYLGIQKATLYHHIRSKEDLLYEICVQSLRNISVAVAAARDAAAPADRLKAMVDAHLQTSLNDRDMHSTMLIELALPPARSQGADHAETRRLRGRYPGRQCG